MENDALVAYIAAGGGIVAAIVTGIFSLIKVKGAKKHTLEIEDALTVSGKVFPSVYSIKEISKEISVEADGSGSQMQAWSGLTTSQHFDYLEIPFHYTVEGDDAVLLEPEGRESLGSSLPVKLISDGVVENNSGKKRLEGKFQIQGSCGPDSDGVSFWYKQQFKGSYLMNREAAESAYKNSKCKTEYSASSVIVPISCLKLKIQLPNNFTQKAIMPSTVVFIGSTHVVNETETLRIKNGFTINGTTLSLQVRDPVVGMYYAITWMPPTSQG